jgi:hypothetical protein
VIQMPAFKLPVYGLCGSYSSKRARTITSDNAAVIAWCSNQNEEEDQFLFCLYRAQPQMALRTLDTPYSLRSLPF